jgi:hypothetical protein
MPEEKKPFTFSARIGGKPFKVQLNRECHVTGLSDDKYWYGFTAPVVVWKGDVFSADSEGLIVNGKLIERNFRPRKKIGVKIGWAAKKVRIAIFPSELVKKHGIWIACDVTSYNMAQGKGAFNALRSLIHVLKGEQILHREAEMKGKKVIRWRVDKLPGVRQDLAKMEEKAKKEGMILDNVDWEKSVLPSGKWWKDKVAR